MENIKRFQFKYIPTIILAQLITSYPLSIFEVRLILSNSYFATHFLFFKNEILFDEGIDGEEIETFVSDFIIKYRKSDWIIDQIIFSDFIDKNFI